LQAEDEFGSIGVTEFGGTLEHDGRFQQRYGGATVGVVRIVGTQVRGSAGDVEAIGIIMEIGALRVGEQRVRIMEDCFADLNGTRRVSRIRLFRTTRARTQ